MSTMSIILPIKIASKQVMQKWTALIYITLATTCFASLWNYLKKESINIGPGCFKILKAFKKYFLIVYNIYLFCKTWITLVLNETNHEFYRQANVDYFNSYSRNIYSHSKWTKQFLCIFNTIDFWYQTVWRLT